MLSIIRGNSQLQRLIFIANKTEKENYDDLKDKALKLENRFETFMPIFHSEKHNYSTIRFVKNSKVKAEQDCVYDID